MRLVILTQYFQPEMGAPQSRLLELAKGLQDLDCSVSVVTALPNYPIGKIFSAYRNRFNFRESIEGIDVKRYWLFASNSRKALPRIVSMLSFSLTCLCSITFMRRFKPDYLLVESPPLTLAGSGMILSRLVGARLIMNVSDLWPLSAKELGSLNGGVFYRIIEKIENFLYRKSFLCVGQSQEILDHISKVRSSGTFLFRNGVDIRRFEHGVYDAGKRNYLVYAGLLGVAQGILSICQNLDFKALRLEFHIYGDGVEKKEILKLVSESPDSGIKYMGVLARDAVPAVLNSYGGTIIPLVKNIYGAVPSKIYEAMAAGLPILFSGGGEGAMIVLREKAGWVNKPGLWKELEENLKAFATISQEEYLAMRRQNQRTAALKFNRSKQIFDFHNELRKRNDAN